MQIDFPNIPHTNQTMIHVPFEGALALLGTLYQMGALDCFAVEIRPPFTCCSVENNGIASEPGQLCITFDLHNGTNRRGEELRRLWSQLKTLANLDRFYFKTGGIPGRNYEVTPDGTVLKYFEPDDGSC
jgi:hypothetical protein